MSTLPGGVFTLPPGVEGDELGGKVEEADQACILPVRDVGEAGGIDDADSEDDDEEERFNTVVAPEVDVDSEAG